MSSVIKGRRLASDWRGGPLVSCALDQPSTATTVVRNDSQSISIIICLEACLIDNKLDQLNHTASAVTLTAEYLP